MTDNSSSVPHWIKDDSISAGALRAEVTSCAQKLCSSALQNQRDGSDQLYQLILSVWALDTHLARDAADIVCEEIRENGGLKSLLQLCTLQDKGLRLSVIKALEQVMVSANRTYIAGHELFDFLVGVACSRDSLELVQCGTGILENLFKESAETCQRLIKGGALEGIIFACRYSDSTTLQHCAAALANCAMYGDPRAQRAMVIKKADHWLFPLAFSDDSVVEYYALLAICFLAANVHLVEHVTRSGTLDLVLPFVSSQDPEEFVKTSPNHAHGRSAEWLSRLVPLLVSKSEEARSLAAFHFAMEANLKKKQQRLHIFKDIDAVRHLQQAAKQGSHLTSRLCCQALTTIDAPLPHYHCWDVLSWSTEHVRAWVADIGLRELASAFPEHLVTGNILLDLTMEDLEVVGFQSRLRCKWFLEQVGKLRCLADVSARDRDNICKLLTEISKDLAVYRVDFVRRGVTKALLPLLTDEILMEIGVHSSLDRLKIMTTVGEFPDSSNGDSPDRPPRSCVPLSAAHKKKYDVFISYRRSTGSQLASLLKVHLHVRGLSVFLDVAELGSGKFDDALLTTISNCFNTILVLSPNSLDRCLGDIRVQDWVHKELLCALDNGINVVPVMDGGFQWPKEGDLPEGIRPVCKINGVNWTHEYQDACVDKLISFLRLPPTSRKRSMSHSVSFAPK